MKKVVEQQNYDEDDERELLSGTGDDSIDAAIRMERMLVSLEKEFRRDLVPADIIMKVLKLTCEFYEGDWVGALDIQQELDVWTPRWWFNAHTQAMTNTSFYEYENVSDYPEWAEAILNEQVICILDTEEIARTNPKEYQQYLRLSAKSVIAAPYYKGVTGFLIVRNPKKHAENPDYLKLMAYVVSCEMNDQRLLDNCRHKMQAEEISDSNEVLIRLFGGLEIITAQGIVKSESIIDTQIAQIICYLCIHQKHAHPPRAVANALFPDSDNAESFAANMKYSIYRFRQSYGDLFVNGHLICSSSSGYELNPNMHIMTDLDLFDELYNTASYTSNVDDKRRILEKIMNLYKGEIFPPCTTEQWLLPITVKYHDRYLEMADALFQILDRYQDYSEIHEYASSALRYEMHNGRLYYWLIVSMVEKQQFELARKEYDCARGNIEPLSFQALTEKLNIRYGESNKAASR